MSANHPPAHPRFRAKRFTHRWNCGSAGRVAGPVVAARRRRGRSTPFSLLGEKVAPKGSDEGSRSVLRFAVRPSRGRRPWILTTKNTKSTNALSRLARRRSSDLVRVFRAFRGSSLPAPGCPYASRSVLRDPSSDRAFVRPPSPPRGRRRAAFRPRARRVAVCSPKRESRDERFREQGQ